MTTAQIGVERSLWEDWKMTVPRNKSLETRINELIEADKNGNVNDD
jgi:Txe/YoeB family toxin of Txe-Axe toxin-antitoxin module